jgi:predicted P-loop ATPase
VSDTQAGAIFIPRNMTIIKEYALQSKLDGQLLDLYPDGVLSHWLHDYNPLSVDHLKQLHADSAISLETIIKEEYRTVREENEVFHLGFARHQAKHVPGLLLPIRDVDGAIVDYQFRPDNPRVKEGEKEFDGQDGIRKQEVIKYEFPKGHNKRLHIPFACSKSIGAVDNQLWVVEGHKKAACLASNGKAAVMIDGVWAWRNGENGALPDWDSIPLKGREVVICFDSDAWSNRQVGKALSRLKAWLETRGAEVVSLILPNVGANKKSGIDDWFAHSVHHTVDELDRMVLQSKAMAKQTDVRASTSAEYLKLLMEKFNLRFQYNEVTGTLECNRQPMDDYLRFEIRTKLRDAGYGGKILTPIEEAWHMQAKHDSYHPIAEYLNGLKWDGQDSITKLSSHFIQTHDHEAAMVEYDMPGYGPLQLWLTKWLVGAVARVLHPTPVRNGMLVFDGGQTIGKSTFCRWLCKSVENYFVDDEINPEDKDHKIMIASKFIWEVSELGAIIRRKDRELLKGFLTKQVVDERGAYQRYKTRQKAMVSFIGTINDEGGFLNDPTGSSRFMVCSVIRIDFEYSKIINPDQVWAQAVKLYHEGYDWKLDSNERLLQEKINAHYRVDNPMVGEILEHYDIDPNSPIFTSTRDIMKKLQKDATNTGLMMRLGSALKNELGLKKGRQRDEDEVERCRLKGIPRPQSLPGYYGLIAKGDTLQP